MAARTLERTRGDLAAFLRAQRESLTPQQVGLPSGGRRRTPGLRREEVAALAGIGVTWYTWLEQGRDIGVSDALLDNLARVFRLDAAARRHLFLLALQRPPAEPGVTWCVVPPLVRRLLDEVMPHAAYVSNLRWDVLAFNDSADALFGLSAQAPARRNLLWLLFTDPALRARLPDWELDARRMLSSFRRDHARADVGSDVHTLVDELQDVSPEFRDWWPRHEVHAGCTGTRRFVLGANAAPVFYEHTSLTIDDERHLRLVLYMIAIPAQE